MNEMLDELRKPFHPSHITWKPGAIKGDRALAMPYADLRAYMNRLDEVCGDEWEVNYEPWGPDRIICRLTIGGVTRSSTGETTNESEKNEIGGTVAEAQAFKRASAMFGLGRYLYNLPSGWVDYDPQSRKFTDKAKAHLTGLLMQHYRRATESKEESPKPAQQAQGASGDKKTQDNPFDDTTPYYVAAWQKLTGKHYDLVKWIQALQRKNGPCSKDQYGLVTGIVDDLTNNEHNYALSVLCQAEISKANVPSAMAVSALLKVLQKEIKGEDGVKIANPEYRKDMAAMVTDIAAAMEPLANVAELEF